MFSRDVLPCDPKKIISLGAIVLGSTIVFSLLLLSFFSSPSSEFAFYEKKEAHRPQIMPLSLGLSAPSYAIVPPSIHQELSISFDPARPNQQSQEFLIIQLKKSGQVKKVNLPCKIDLEFIEQEKLHLSESRSPFWIELNFSSDKKIQGIVFIEDISHQKREVERFFLIAQEPPIQGVDSLAIESPFRLLGEAKWLGLNKFNERYDASASAQRIEIESEIIDLKEKDWLVWSDGKWIQTASIGAFQLPIARIQSVQSKLLILEGWEGDQYIRLSLNGVVPPLKGKIDDFHTIRVRSSQQMSCMLEKQWLILRIGDWALRHGGKWKVLKKKEEKEQFKSGKIEGELFVFEKIETRGAQKFIQGSFFSADRTQVHSSEWPVPAHGLQKRKNEEGPRKIGHGR